MSVAFDVSFNSVEGSDICLCPFFQYEVTMIRFQKKNSEVFHCLSYFESVTGQGYCSAAFQCDIFAFRKDQWHEVVGTPFVNSSDYDVQCNRILSNDFEVICIAKIGWYYDVGQIVHVDKEEEMAGQAILSELAQYW